MLVMGNSNLIIIQEEMFTVTYLHFSILMMHFYANQIQVLTNYEVFFFQGDNSLTFFITSHRKLITHQVEDLNLHSCCQSSMC